MFYVINVFILSERFIYYIGFRTFALLYLSIFLINFLFSFRLQTFFFLCNRPPFLFQRKLVEGKLKLADLQTFPRENPLPDSKNYLITRQLVTDPQSEIKGYTSTYTLILSVLNCFAAWNSLHWVNGTTAFISKVVTEELSITSKSWRNKFQILVFCIPV